MNIFKNIRKTFNENLHFQVTLWRKLRKKQKGIIFKINLDFQIVYHTIFLDGNI